MQQFAALCGWTGQPLWVMDRGPDEPAARDQHAELEALCARVAQLEGRAPVRSRLRLRSFFSVLLILEAAVLTPLNVLSSWASGVAGDTDRYADMREPPASDPEVQAAVTNRVTDAVMSRLDIDALPADVAPADRPVVDKALGKPGEPFTPGRAPRPVPPRRAGWRLPGRP